MRAICCSDGNQEIYYLGYKKYHAVKYQALSTLDGIIAHHAGPYRGWEKLQLVNDPNPVKRIYIYGNPAYSLSYGIISAYQAQPNQPLSLLLQEVNMDMSSLHISVEYRFARLIMLWRYNRFKIGLNIRLLLVAAYFMVSILFCNISSCFHENMTSKRFCCSPPSVNSYLASTSTRQNQLQHILCFPICSPHCLF
ncbi:hypothetical protein L873DRAFT_1889964 [Choiromyces venosus 120613-1]|uniref:DDE Tnp4 domain-containing protein n=1 Tax=Choiromyces venosus 120613-1 TaxID=1336337 RepID=A0A3N4JT07_9PEZI|nr:hypothetical protein L873DRAFT_1889964 [Choiromyces venosus 120613-1]